MKKYFLFLAGSAFILASCGSNNNASQAPSQAQIDSIANAKAAEMNAANAAKNDSTLKAVEAEKAAAEAKAKEAEAHKGSAHHGGGKKTETAAPASPTTPPPPPPPTGGMKAHSDNAPASNTNTGAKAGGGMRAHQDTK